MAITEADFCDNLSKDLFYYRNQFNITKDYNYILEMLCKEYVYSAKKINKLADDILKQLRCAQGKFVIYGAGKTAKKTYKFLANNNAISKFKCYATTNPSKEKDCCLISELKKEDDLIYVIPAGRYTSEMYHNLRARGGV